VLVVIWLPRIYFQYCPIHDAEHPCQAYIASARIEPLSDLATKKATEIKQYNIYSIATKRNSISFASLRSRFRCSLRQGGRKRKGHGAYESYMTSRVEHQAPHLGSRFTCLPFLYRAETEKSISFALKEEKKTSPCYEFVAEPARVKPSIAFWTFMQTNWNIPGAQA
jgi:hypothetical protein